MTEEKEALARLDERSNSQDDRVSDLEKNQRWAVLGIIGLVAKAVFDVVISKGAGQ